MAAALEMVPQEYRPAITAQGLPLLNGDPSLMGVLLVEIQNMNAQPAQADGGPSYYTSGETVTFQGTYSCETPLPQFAVAPFSGNDCWPSSATWASCRVGDSSTPRSMS